MLQYHPSVIRSTAIGREEKSRNRRKVKFRFYIFYTNNNDNKFLTRESIPSFQNFNEIVQARINLIQQGWIYGRNGFVWSDKWFSQFYAVV